MKGKRWISNVYITRFERKTMQEITFHLSTLCYKCQILILSPIDSSLYMLYTTPYSISKGVIIFNISLSIHPIDLNMVMTIFFTVNGFSPLDYLHFIDWESLVAGPWLLGTWLVAQINVQAGYWWHGMWKIWTCTHSDEHAQRLQKLIHLNLLQAISWTFLSFWWVERNLHETACKQIQIN